MSYSEGFFILGLQILAVVCLLYFVAWVSIEPHPSPTKHTAIALSLGVITPLLIMTVFKICLTSFYSTSEYLSEISRFITEALVPLFRQLSVFSLFMFAGAAAFQRFGPNLFSRQATKKGENPEDGNGAYKGLNEKERTEVKIEILEEMLQAQREKLKKFE
ncbi:hypothetical protein N7478_005715 [Penicillium angulare]|uniref:uncharacterized protein n=1 Tax=Penicillium angulare TaxID=116970 RepID=UPI002540D403|nr:uncharacterized protein N7478_005715 [Penicillium angulare]KAJ5280343.1 hypothetical protein N7478_005715 [Penicillium angulare]